MGNRSFERYIDVFFLQEMKENGYNRYDIIVRLLAVEEYYGKNKYGFELYDKMQKIRFKEKPFISEAKRENSLEIFCKLIQNIENDGYKGRSHPILLNDDTHLINGSHRLALCIFHKINFVTCEYSKIEKDFHTHIQYGIEWFQKQYKEEECLIVKNRMKELLNERGYLAYAIIWPEAYFYREIENIVLQYFEIVSYCDLIFENKQKLIKFIEYIYSGDPYRPNRATNKLINVKETVKGLNIRLYQMKFYDKDMEIEIGALDGRDVRFKKIGYLQSSKSKIRTEIKQMMKEYVFDNAFHCGQTINENNFLQRIYERILIGDFQI